MKQLTHKILGKELLIFATLMIVSTLIWIEGPSLLINNIHPLLAPQKRLFLIGIIFTGWIILSLLYKLPNTNKEKNPLFTHSPELLKKLQILQGRFQGAIDFFNKTIINRDESTVDLAKLPWYLMIGPKNSGQTTLLANSNVSFILSKQFKPELLRSLPPSESCDWWATRDLVLIDVPSAYTQSNKSSTPTILWSNLLNLIHDHRKAQSLNGIIITLNLPELIHQQTQQQKHIVLDIRQRINEIRERFNTNIPCYLVITKSDLLPGFAEFFNDSSSEELAQMWGITLPSLRVGDKVTDLLTHRFNALIKRLNKQLLWRLHKERSPNARALIKDFPLHVERIKEKIIQFVKVLSQTNLNLSGVFFTSSIQPTPEKTSHSSALTINASHHQALQILQPTALPDKSYFVKQLLLQAVFHKEDYAPTANLSKTRHKWPQWANYTIAFSSVIVTALFLGYDFKNSIQSSSVIQNNLAQYQIKLKQNELQGSHFINALPLLDSLQQASENASPKLSHLGNQLAVYSNKSKQLADDVYAKALQTIVLPEIKNVFEAYLLNTNDKNPAQIYAILKAYLMIGDAQNRDINFVTKTIKQLLPESIKPNVSEQLSNHIKSAFDVSPATYIADPEIVAMIRKKLTDLPADELAYVILKNINDNNLDSPIKLGTDTKDSSVFTSKALANQIPNMFTAEGFKAILSGELTIAATEAEQGNWVLGNYVTPLNHTISLTEQLHNRYLSNYVDLWESQLANIKLYSPKTLAELKSMLETVTSNNSPLLQMLQTIQKNTAFDAITHASLKLQAFNELLTNATKNHNNYLFQMFFSLRELNLYIQNITSQRDIGIAAYQATKDHLLRSAPDAINNMQTLSQQVPEPMKSWLNTLSNHTWRLISKSAAHYIDIAWQKEVMLPYHADIAERFPFVRDAKQEVNLNAFTHFLGQQGIVTSFYQQYLKPFVEEDSATHTLSWRTTNNQKLPVKNEILTQMQNISKIQRAFFPNGDNQLFVQFALQPVTLTPDIKSFNVAINGQKFNYKKNDANTPHVFSWPGNLNTNHGASINFITPTNQLVTQTIPGDWGWFRLVNKAIKNIPSRKEIALDFNLDGHSATYSLFTQGHINPFLLGNLDQIQLPESLV